MAFFFDFPKAVGNFLKAFIRYVVLVRDVHKLTVNLISKTWGLSSLTVGIEE